MESGKGGLMSLNQTARGNEVIGGAGRVPRPWFLKTWKPSGCMGVSYCNKGDSGLDGALPHKEGGVELNDEKRGGRGKAQTAQKDLRAARECADYFRRRGRSTLWLGHTGIWILEGKGGQGESESRTVGKNGECARGLRPVCVMLECKEGRVREGG